ncbi:MAG: hypothetical protein LCH73_03230 [Proteobacteria bacterium]|nr:hypothetical protein [Pseudomonadota bacterium]
MRWSRLIAVVGVAAGTGFASYDEGANLLAACEPFGLDWYVRVFVLGLLTLTYAGVLSAGAFLILRCTGRRRGFFGSMVEMVITIAVALMVGFGMAIADPVISYVVAAACTQAFACTGSEILGSFRSAINVAANWPNTPVAGFMVTLFVVGAFVVQDVLLRESAGGR